MFVCKVPDLLCAVTHIILMCVACFTVCGGPVVCPFPLGVYLLRVRAAWAVGCVGTGAAPVRGWASGRQPRRALHLGSLPARGSQSRRGVGEGSVSTCLATAKVCPSRVPPPHTLLPGPWLREERPAAQGPPAGTAPWGACEPLCRASWGQRPPTGPQPALLHWLLGVLRGCDRLPGRPRNSRTLLRPAWRRPGLRALRAPRRVLTGRWASYFGRGLPRPGHGSFPRLL